MTDDTDPPDIDEDTVEVSFVGDYNVELDIDGLPDGAVAVDYYQDEPRLLIRAEDIRVPKVAGDGTETVWAVEFEAHRE